MNARHGLLAFCLGLFSLSAVALEYRSVSAPVAILYDAPSAQGKRLYLIRQFAPVEVVVNVEGWTKVRDAEGTLAWIDKKALSEKRTVVVVAPRAELRQTPDANAPVVLEAEKWVALEFIEIAQPGWAKVRHRDGVIGFVRVTQVWGL